jgi:transcriptional regulator with XRE-family HTH domain
MSPKRKTGMDPTAFKRMLSAKKMTQAQAAVKIGVTRRTIIRWAKGTTPISEAAALLIRARLK